LEAEDSEGAGGVAGVMAAGGGDVVVAVEFEDPDGEVPDRAQMIADAPAAATD